MRTRTFVRRGVAAMMGAAMVAASPPASGAAPPPGAGSAFAVDLFRALRATSGNLTVSPASLSMALTMPWAGARGATATEMARVLHLAGTPDVVLRGVGTELARWNDPKRTAYTLRVVNRLFPEKTYTLEKPFLERMTRLGAPAELLDFRGASDASRRRINTWVAGETRDRIRDLLPPPAINAETRLVLVNALYLLADWLSPFTREATRPVPFHSPQGSRPVPTMHQVGHFGFAAADGVKLLEMPYVGGELGMTFVLPDARDGLPALEQSLEAKRLDSWIAALKPQKVVVALPKFTLDPAAPLALAPVLKGLGMRLAFDPEHADFTGIAAPRNPADRLVISDVFHKTFVKVDEKGTEAAAATAVVMQRAGAAPDPQRPPEFRADHPFLFLVRDLRTGAILFLGRVTDPTGA
jgi:serpin B